LPFVVSSQSALLLKAPSEASGHHVYVFIRLPPAAGGLRQRNKANSALAQQATAAGRAITIMNLT
jgi:hypothetical protein